MNKTALMISVALTAFALIIVAAVFSAGKTPLAATAAGDSEANAQETTAVVDVQLQQAISDREAAYQDLITQANTRLDTLQQENQALQEQLNTIQIDLQPTSAPEGITPETAAQVAASWMGDNQIYSVEGTAIRGQAVYKVTFSSGAIVYISVDGQVVGSQAPATTLNVSNRGIRSSGGGEHDEHDGHEGNDD